MADRNLVPVLAVGAAGLLGFWLLTKEPVYGLGQVIAPGAVIARIDDGQYWIEYEEAPGVLYGPYTGREIQQIAAAYA